MAQEACQRLQQEFDAKLAGVLAAKEREAKHALGTVKAQLAELDAKFSTSQQVRHVLFPF